MQCWLWFISRIYTWLLENIMRRQKCLNLWQGSEKTPFKLFFNGAWFIAVSLDKGCFALETSPGSLTCRWTKAWKLTRGEIQQPLAALLLLQHGGAAPVTPGDDGLNELQFPPQRLILLVTAGDLQPQHRVAVVHQLADLRHRCFGQRLHDGRQLRVKPRIARHVQPPRNDTSRRTAN